MRQAIIKDKLTGNKNLPSHCDKNRDGSSRKPFYFRLQHAVRSSLFNLMIN